MEVDIVFDSSMNVSEMERIIFQIMRQSNNIIEEAIGMLSSEDLNQYINVFKKEKNVLDSDFAWQEKVGNIAFLIASEIENRSSQSGFLDL